jgi:phosphoglucosamine mutase
VTLRFGTDGVRGVANLDLTPELVVALGRAAARVLGGDRVVIGRDTRISGPLLESALASGFAAEGAHVELVGIVPTPAVAWASAATDAVGAMISASHNRYPDNGIKLFAAGGRKLRDDTEAALEAELDRLVHGDSDATSPTGDTVGTINPGAEYGLAWVDAVVATVDADLSSLRVVVDCGNGAASSLAPFALRRLGIEPIVLHAAPNGTNINEGCGSTHPGDLQRAVVDANADIGIAFDGDADRVVAVDARGEVVDGDQIIAVLAIDRRERGALRDDTVVVTVMSNLGFRHAMAAHDITVVDTPVGDRFVLDALEAGAYTLGGEQSGHIIFPDFATTGDGLLSATQLLDVMVRTTRSLEDLTSVMTRLPQVLKNVRIGVRGVDVDALVAVDLAAARAELGDDGRVLVRSSGTEPVVRVMVEAPTVEQANAVADRLVTAVTSRTTS